MTSLTPFTWGIIGPGKIANKFATAITLVEGAILGAIASRDRSKAEAFAKTHATTASPGTTAPSSAATTASPGGISIYDSYEALAADPSIDAVYIATPHGYHAEHALLCLRKGKAVLCEKPMALSARQVTEMVEAANTHRAFLMEAMWTRFLPIIHTIDTMIAEGKIGEIRYVRADFGFLAPFNPEGRLYNLRLGGGSLLDIGIYPLFLCLHLLGTPSRITATGHLAPTGSDDLCHAILEFAGPTAILTSTLQCQTSITAEIAGTKGLIRLPTPWYKNDHFTYTPQGEAEQTIQLEPMINGFEYQIREVIRCVTAGLIESPALPLDFSSTMARTMDTIRAQLGVRYPTE